MNTEEIVLIEINNGEMLKKFLDCYCIHRNTIVNLNEEVFRAILNGSIEVTNEQMIKLAGGIIKCELVEQNEIAYIVQLCVNMTLSDFGFSVCKTCVIPVLLSRDMKPIIIFTAEHFTAIKINIENNNIIICYNEWIYEEATWGYWTIKQTYKYDFHNHVLNSIEMTMF